MNVKLLLKRMTKYINEKVNVLVPLSIENRIFDFWDPKDNLDWKNRLSENELIVRLLIQSNLSSFFQYAWNHMRFNYEPAYPLETRNIDSVLKKFLEFRFRYTRERYLFLLKNNINKPLKTNRLILRPADKEGNDLKAIRSMLKQDGDFKLFTQRNLSRQNLKSFVFTSALYFIVERQSDHACVGYVDLHPDLIFEERNYYPTRHFSTAYYIKKSERGKGYAKEALVALYKAAFSNRLKRHVPHPTLNDRTLIKTIKPDYIRAGVWIENIASNSILISLGFVKEGILHAAHVRDKKLVDFNSYYLSKATFDSCSVFK
jgi:RimJ/RimL family protein N-acetyltransferase